MHFKLFLFLNIFPIFLDLIGRFVPMPMQVSDFDAILLIFLLKSNIHLYKNYNLTKPLKFFLLAGSFGALLSHRHERLSCQISLSIQIYDDENYKKMSYIETKVIK